MKKYYFLIVGFLFFGIVNGQIVNIPDPNFKSKIMQWNAVKDINNSSFVLDANGNGEVEVSEAHNVFYINLENKYLYDLTGIEHFINTKELRLKFNYLTNLNLTTLTNLEYLDCYLNTLITLNINGLSNLKFLDCNSNDLTSLDLSTNVNLEQLKSSGNNILSLDIQNKLFLTYINCGGTNPNAIVNLNNLPSLLEVDGFGGNIKEFTMSGVDNLTHLKLKSNNLTTLDASNMISAQLIDVGNNYNLASLFVKNGANEIVYKGVNIGQSLLQYICGDETQVSSLQYGFSGVVNSYCSFVPGGIFYDLQGTSTCDVNNNGCDENDVIIKNMKYQISNQGLSTTIIDDGDNYKISLYEDSYLITPILENPNYYSISPVSATVNLSSINSPLIQNFCISPLTIKNDVEISILPLNISRPGFDSNYKIVYKNKGNQTQSGSINLVYNDAVLDLVSTNPALSIQTVSNLSWDFSNLLPFETREILVTLNLNSPIETPPVAAGYVLNYTATISGATDETPLDNISNLNQTVVNSFDPNDKTCLEGATITPNQVGKEVHYMIRFENTGTANAQNIVVKDMIDTTKFDVNSLIPISGSHSFVTRITETNKVEFIFENIQLPFDDANNDGYVAFKIKTKPNLVLGNTFSNTASIYFDYNFPIVTNTATTTVSNVLANQDFIFANYISINPNPAKETLTINAKNIEVSSISIYNTLGQLVQVIPNAKEVKTIDVSQLKSGNYFIKVVSDKGMSSSKFIKE